MGGDDERLDLAQPRAFGELLRTTFALFRAHSGLFLSLTLLIVAPVSVLVDGVWGGALRDGGGATASNAANAVASLLTVFVVPALVTALHAVAVRQLAAGTVPTVGVALRDAAPRMPAAIGAVLISTLGVMLGALLLIVPGIWLAIRWYFAAQAVVLEGLEPAAALRRSAELVKGRWWETFGRLLGSGICFMLVGLVFGAIAASIHNGVIYVALYTVVQGVLLSLTALFGTLLFFSMRTAGRTTVAG